VRLPTVPPNREVREGACGVAKGAAAVTTALERLEQLGRAGVTVSICCGPSGSSPFRWSVQAMSRSGEEFEQPFAANDFAHAVEIAELESTKRGWL
jgi:hypothetical protein